MEAQNQPTHAPLQEFKLPTHVEGEGEVPKEEIKRLGLDWQNAVNLVWETNKLLVDRDYATDTQITADLKAKNGQDYAPPAEEITSIKQARDQEIAAARETGVEKISDTDPNVLAAALQIVKEDGPLKEHRVNEPAVLAEAKRREAVRRIALMKASAELYAASDEINTITSKAEQAVEAALIAEKNKRLQQLTEATKQKDAAAAEVTALPEGEGEKLREELKAKITPEYYDKDQGFYYRLGADGKPDKNSPVSTPGSYETVDAELGRIAKLQDATGNPTSQAIKAKKIGGALIFNKTENAFRVFTEKEIKAKEMERGAASIEKVGQLVLRDLLSQADALDPKDIANNRDLLLLGFDRDRLAIYLDKLTTETDPWKKQYLISAVYEKLHDLAMTQNNMVQSTKFDKDLWGKLAPGTQQQIRYLLKDQAVIESVKTIHHDILNNYLSNMLTPKEISTLNMDHFFRNCSIAAYFQEKGVKPKDILKNLSFLEAQGMTFSEGDRNLIGVLTQKNIPGAPLDNILQKMGMDSEEFLHLPRYISQKAEKIVDMVATPDDKSSPDWQGRRAKRIQTMRTQAQLVEKMFKSPRLTKAQVLIFLGGGAMLLAMFGPSILNFGAITEETREGQPAM